MIRELSVLHFTVLILLAIFGFNIISTSVILVYVILALAYLLPLLAELHSSRSQEYHLLVLLTTTTMALLLVIDPREIGFYGYDPYQYTLPSFWAIGDTSSIATFVTQTQSWPGYYVFLKILTSVTGLPITPLGKYFPLITVALPVFVYLAICRLSTPKIGFLTALGFASTRTVLLFESKFVDETTAVGYLFLLLYLLAALNRSRRRSLIGLILVTSIVVTHHAISFIAGMLVLIWLTVDILITQEWIPSRFQPRIHSNKSPSIILGLGVVVLAAVVFLYWAPGLTTPLLTNILMNPFHIAGGGTAGIGSSGSGLRSLVSSAVLVVLVVFALIATVGLFSRQRFDPWVSSWTVFAGVIAVLYAVSLIAGQLVPLDPIRFLIVLVPTLLAVSLIVIKRLGEWQSVRVVVGVIVVILIITQIAAIPPHVLISEPSETIVGEGHYSLAQFEAASWVSSYGQDVTIAVKEPGLWASRGIFNIRTDEKCMTGLRARPKNKSKSSIIYDVGELKISKC